MIKKRGSHRRNFSQLFPALPNKSPKEGNAFLSNASSILILVASTCLTKLLLSNFKVQAPVGQDSVCFQH
jgi:hypothetical protein